ncbi:protein of unknown function 71 DUF71 -CONTAINING PROTEIN [Salix koriyanagi]|uniref:Diphthine--ammonia ligase n=1 Tax=Salix koriyanagi TaxID=2511006 RepID=A0A9Q0W6I9_9ROSI|nr:protein of unknown function 71 DUF71 -CONTAINING PROTEIN [Salix koriyanagi]
MKVVALVSGGKDSCYAMMKCIEYGHEIVALANLMPADDSVDELDSFMYQTVGHQIIASYAECMGLPLFRRRIQGSTRHQTLNYKTTPGDEVEDMFVLLNEVKRQIPSITAVSSGAIASDYQRLRVESVCSRLGLVSLAYLWKQDQSLLLHEMITNRIWAITVKVAAIGLVPSKHLGKGIAFLNTHLHKLKELYGINVCGEGGEYETLTLDCPLFGNARIVLDEFQIVLHSPGSIASVGVIHPLAFHLENKETAISLIEVRDDIIYISRTKKDNIFSICCWLQDSCKNSAGSHEDLATVLKHIESQLTGYGFRMGACPRVWGKLILKFLWQSDNSKNVLHVQSISSWAPSCIGPYSQATLHKEILHMAGQLGLDPATMTLCNEGPSAELEQALENSEAVANVFNCSISTSTIVFTIYCSANTPLPERLEIQEKQDCFLEQMRLLQLEYGSKCKILYPIFLYVLVPDLPKRASVEVKPILFVPEDTETAWHDSCIQKCVVSGKICAVILSITEDHVAKIGSESLGVNEKDVDRHNSVSKGNMERVSRFCVYLLDKGIIENGFSWEDTMNLRIYFPTNSGIQMETLSLLFKNAMNELAEMDQRVQIGKEPIF